MNHWSYDLGQWIYMVFFIRNGLWIVLYSILDSVFLVWVFLWVFFFCPFVLLPAWSLKKHFLARRQCSHCITVPIFSQLFFFPILDFRCRQSIWTTTMTPLPVPTQYFLRIMNFSSRVLRSGISKHSFALH